MKRFICTIALMLSTASLASDDETYNNQQANFLLEEIVSHVAEFEKMIAEIKPLVLPKWEIVDYGSIEDQLIPIDFYQLIRAQMTIGTLEAVSQTADLQEYNDIEVSLAQESVEESGHLDIDDALAISQEEIKQAVLNDKKQ